MKVNIKAFSSVLREIDNGWLFEDFAHKFLNARFGRDFIPVGGSKDKGVDGFQHIFSSKSNVLISLEKYTSVSVQKYTIYG
ncbi:MAG: hypothetical protein RIA69_01495 [Cyclobacteriaceae bacterium]